MANLSILQVNDLHAQVWPHYEHFWQGGHGVYRAGIGGLSRIAGAVKKQQVGTAHDIVRKYLAQGPVRTELTHDKFIWV